MTEAETISSLNEIADVTVTFIAMWVSFTFGYLTVAYFLGKALSTFQCLVVSILYTIVAAYFGFAAVGYLIAWHAVLNSKETLYTEVWIFDSQIGWVWGAAIFIIAGTLVSLYFMYDARQERRQ